MDALEALKKWDRKYYHYKIETGGHYQPGDGVQVTLEAHGRKVCVGEEELTNYDTDVFPSVGDVILEAIRLWHADDKPKNYQVYLHVPVDSPPWKGDGEWRWWGNGWPSSDNRMVQVKLIARNEEESIRFALAGYEFPVEMVQTYERGYAEQQPPAHTGQTPDPNVGP